MVGEQDVLLRGVAGLGRRLVVAGTEGVEVGGVFAVDDVGSVGEEAMF